MDRRFNTWAALWVGFLILLLVAEGIGWQIHLNRLAAQFKVAQARLNTDRVAALAKQQENEFAQDAGVERGYQSDLTNQAWLSGSLARERHQAEWNRRLAHEPDLARTLLETNLLVMAKLGQDPTLAAQSALEKVAYLSAPPGSRVEVDADGDGFRVRVAFMMSRLSQNEAGAVTKYHSAAGLRTEIQELSAQVLRDLYDYCGSRGITSISVTCDHTLRQAVVPANATDDERTLLLERVPPVPARLYRVSLDQLQARAIADWRRVTLSHVTKLYQVEYDGLKTLTIAHDPFSQEDAHDAAGPLEF